MRRCRNCFIAYLVWSSVSFPSMSLSAGRSTSSACSHCSQDVHKAVWARSRLCILFQVRTKYLDFQWSGTFVTRLGIKTEIVGRKDFQLGLYFARRGSVITMNFTILFFPYLAPWDWSGGKPVLCSDVGPWWDMMERSPAAFSSYGLSSQMASIYWPVLCALCEVCM